MKAAIQCQPGKERIRDINTILALQIFCCCLPLEKSNRSQRTREPLIQSKWVSLTGQKGAQERGGVLGGSGRWLVSLTPVYLWYTAESLIPVTGNE